MKEVATLRSFKTVPVFLHNGPTVSCVCVLANAIKCTTVWYFLVSF